jgi:hexosaminidase
LYKQAWAQFVNVSGKRELPRLDYYAGGFNYRIPTAGAVIEGNMVKANVQLPGMTIRYTTDGSEPNAKSKIYSQPIPYKGMIKFRVFDSKGRGGRAVSVGSLQLSVGKKE